MKKYLILLTVLMLSAFTMNASVSAFDGGDDPEDINLEKQNNGDDPTSLNPFTIHAYKTSTQIVILFSNYYGNASAFVYGLGGTAYSDEQVIMGSGFICIDISLLPTGSYTLTLFADSVYYGYFII